MKICMINGSSKPKHSNSGYLLDCLEDKSNTSNEITRLGWKNFEDDLPQDCDVMVFAFPLYVDGIPSNLLEILEKSEQKIKAANPNVKVYAVINNAFYEATQNRYAAQMMEHWCRHADVDFGGALCVGAGPVVRTSPVGTGSMENLGKGLDTLIKTIENGQVLGENIFIEPNMPKTAYTESANNNWIKAAEKRGLTKDDLLRKL